MTLGTFIALLGIATGTAYWVVTDALNEIQRVSFDDPILERPEPTEVATGDRRPVNILILGSDSRESRTLAADDLIGFRSDAIMVAQLSLDRQKLTVMSIMRDNWVPIQGHADAKINAALSYGGLPLAVNTVENFIGVRIDHVALIDFESFRGLTDAVGGVTVNNEVPFTSHHGKSVFPEGDITLHSGDALNFVRERYAFTDGDYQRVRNQQAYMKGLLVRLLSSETLSDPAQIIDTFQALQPYVLLDHDLDLRRLINLGLSAQDIQSEDVTFLTSPTLGTGASADGQSIVLPDWDAMDGVRNAFRSGTIDELASELTDG
ncbi:MAG: LCP family protein [Leucobacter sp.]